MKPATGGTILSTLGFYISATGLIIALSLFQSYAAGQYIEPFVESLTTAQGRQLDAFLEMNRLLITLGTALLGATGFLLVNGHKMEAGSRALWTAFLSAVCVGLSVFFGYLVYLSVLWMLESQFFDLNNPRVLWPRQAHFYSFLLGVVFFTDFAFHQLREEQERERSQDLSGN
jgi:hypothetical protein